MQTITLSPEEVDILGALLQTESEYHETEDSDYAEVLRNILEKLTPSGA